jgi:hypothetical protein
MRTAPRPLGMNVEKKAERSIRDATKLKALETWRTIFIVFARC